MRIIGIDPGCGRNTGVCVLQDGKVERISTGEPAEAKQLLLDEYVQGTRAVGIEYSPSYHIYQRKGVSTRAMMKIAQNVQLNRSVAEQLIGYSEGIGYEVYRVRPRGTKMDAKWFKEETGWEGRTSSHARDAYITAQRAEYMALNPYA